MSHSSPVWRNQWATWELAYICNYRCPYCPYPFDDPELASRHNSCSAQDWLDFWKRFFDKYGSFSIIVAGGEPTVYPGFFELADGVGEHHDLFILSNMSWTPGKVLKGFKNPKRLTFSGSFHPDEMLWKDFLGKARQVLDAGYYFGASAVAYPPNISMLEDCLQAAEDNGFHMAIDPFFGSFKGKTYPKDYSEEEKAWLHSKTKQKRGAFDYKLAKSPKGKLCWSGSNYMRLYPNGDVSRCAKSMELAEPRLGNIKDNNFWLRESPTPCPSETCFCKSEYMCLDELKQERVTSPGY